MSLARAETLLALRQGESLLLTMGFPLMILAFFSSVKVLDLPGRDVDFLVPGILALAILSTSMVSLAIATAFQRSYKVLKRLATTPVSRPALLAAKTTTILIVEVIQAVAIVALALALGWRANVSVVPALGAVLLGTAAFAGLGLLMAGTLRAEITLAAANGLYLVLLLLGGIVVPLGSLPGWMSAVGRALPAAALAELLRSSLSGGVSHSRDWLVLAGWAIGAPVLAARFFRWE